MEDIKPIEITDPFGFIYLTTNIIDGKRYIGQKQFRKGWKNYLGSGKLFLKAIKKYGRENFSREIIAIAYSKEELNKLEKEFIENHNAVESEDYYNLVEGGGATTGFHHSEESKRKLSESRKGELSVWYGKHHSEKSKQKMSESLKGNKNNLGKHRSEESKKKMSKIMKGKPFTEEHKQNLRKPKSEEHKRKLAISHIGKPLSEETKQKISQANSGERNYNYGKKISNELKRKLSDCQISLTEQQITEIRKKYLTGNYSYSKLAKEYFVSTTTIHNVIHYKYAYAPKDY